MDFETYERERRADYTDFAAVVASILNAAIRADSRLRLQQVKDRAKTPSSLSKKLRDRGLVGTTTLETDIKDLAGCRVIFYTDSDVNLFINSGLMQANFEVLESKLHYPNPKHEAGDVDKLYMSHHYVVKLRPERLSLPEYGRFADMRCEVQVQTILNHAWAEMAHDTIYKTPLLEGLGTEALDALRRRLAKTARKYLFPAGYEFQKIANDFQRMLEGKKLFDEGALDAIVTSDNNNTRAEALEAFVENVLPYYDDIQGEYPRVVQRLVEAVEVARSTAPKPIETPYGHLPARTSAEIVGGVSSVLETYRYADIDVTFNALCELFAGSTNDSENEYLERAAARLAAHELQIWCRHGSAVQLKVIDRIVDLALNERRVLWPLLTTMLCEVLKSEVTGATGSSSTVTIQRGAVPASETLRTIRTKAMDLLMDLMQFAQSDSDRRMILSALEEATRTPRAGSISSDLTRLVLDDTQKLLEYQTEIAATLSYEIRQSLEERAHQIYKNHRNLLETAASNAAVVEACGNLLDSALAFRDAINADREFCLYKTLVGYNSIFSPAWEDPSFGYKEAKAYREAQVETLLGEINDETADYWFDILSRCAQTQSSDLATFPTFGRFLARLGEIKPDIMIGYIERMEPTLARFLPNMLAGLTKSIRADDTSNLIERWLGERRYLGEIAWYMRSAVPFDENLLHRILDSAIADDNALATRYVMVAAETQFKDTPGTLIDSVFLPALQFLTTKSDLDWVRMPWFTWMNSRLLLSMTEDQAAVVLHALVPYPDLEDGAEEIVATIALRWPEKVIEFLEHRQTYASRETLATRYRDLPFDVHDLRAPLARAHEALVSATRRWFATRKQPFGYSATRLLAEVFPDLPDFFRDHLAGYLAGGDREDMAFVLAVLSNYEGEDTTHSLVKDIIAQIDANDPLMSHAENVLGSMGMVAGAFGMVELLKERKTKMQAWLGDPRERIRVFAEGYIRELDRRIAQEQRSAEMSVALRKLDYGEELDGDSQG